MSLTELITLSNIELTRFFFAIILLLVSAHFFGYLLQRFKMPRVIGEIIGGLILGPTLLGFFFPESYAWIFNAFEQEGKLLSLIYWTGLVLLMFISGFEIQKSFDRKDKKLITFILFGAILIPFIAGWLAPNFYDFSNLLGSAGNPLVLKIIIGIAVAVTSIPVIAKIFIDLKISETRFAKIILAVATIEDIVLYIALAIVTGIVSSKSLDLTTIITNVAITLLFFFLILLFAPKIIHLLNKNRFNLLIKSSRAGYILIICFFFSALASILNVNIIFGAFLAGVIIGLMPKEEFESSKNIVKEVSLAFFIPVYFAIVGLKLDLIHNFDLSFFILFFAFATIIKTLGVFVSARFAGQDSASSFNLATAMNARGGPGIVLATVAFEMNIINETFFTTLVLFSIVTSLMSGLWLKFILSKGKPLLTQEKDND